ncbi:MAG: hypothetical protein RDV41_00855 [Planctomycetota bacterium]|nr:hypothetical protein [Planctomycetota bacterium]
MSRVKEALGLLREEIDRWCRGRLWLVRLPLLAWFAYILVRSLADSEYTSLFSSLNLGIHELGHFVFELLGEFIGMAGGTVAQCLAPIISVAMFYRQRDFFAIAVCFGWLSTNLFDVAIYASDARAQSLQLLSPFGRPVQHDWHYLLGKLGLLSADTTIGFLLRAAATLSMLVCLVGGTWVLWLMFRPPAHDETPAC